MSRDSDGVVVGGCGIDFVSGNEWHNTSSESDVALLGKGNSQTVVFLPLSLCCGSPIHMSRNAPFLDDVTFAGASLFIFPLQFEMVAADNPSNPVRGSSSSQCHALVLKTINKAR